MMSGVPETISLPRNTKTTRAARADEVGWVGVPALDEVVLLRGIRARPSVPGQVHSQLADRFFGPGAGADEAGIALPVVDKSAAFALTALVRRG